VLRGRHMLFEKEQCEALCKKQSEHIEQCARMVQLKPESASEAIR
jgi:hypothetical protein